MRKKKYADNTAFLVDSDIKVCVLRNPTDLTYKDRIIELANRSNQLNFTKSRFEKYDFEDYFESQKSIYIHHGAIFVYDKYGDYGLVGFYAFDERMEKRTLDHYYFSCRILNMGVEQAVYLYLRRNYGLNKFELMESRINGEYSYITLVHEFDEHLRNYVANEMNSQKQYNTVVSAGCESGIIGHYLPDSMKPACFASLNIAESNDGFENIKNIIYTIYSDYINSSWSNVGGFNYKRFANRLQDFAEAHKNQKVYLLLASQKYESELKEKQRSFIKKFKLLMSALLHGKSGNRYKRCNMIVRKMAAIYSNVTVIETGDYVFEESEQIDYRHFERIVFKRICERLNFM